MSEMATKIVKMRGNQLKDKKKLDHQQEYYRRLTKFGIAKKQIYSLKALSAV